MSSTTMSTETNDDVIQVLHELVDSTVANNFVSPEVQFTSDYLPSEEEENDEEMDLDFSSAVEDLPRPARNSLQLETSKGSSAQTPKGQSHVSYGAEFPCKRCNFSYKLSDSLRKHQYIKHYDYYVKEERPQTPQVKPGGRALGMQLESSFGTEYPCAHCSNSYKNKKAMITHVKRHHSEQERQKGTMDRSILRTKKENEVYSCQYCTATFEIRESSMEHEKIMHKNAKERLAEISTVSSSAVKCDYCPLFFKNGQGVKSHVNQKHPDMAAIRIENASEVFFCSYCPKKYELFSSLKRHSQAEHNRTPKTPTTKKSNSKTVAVVPGRVEKNLNAASSPEDRKIKNSEQESSNSNPLKCDKCDNEYSSLDFLNKHKLTHAPLLACYECGQVFKQVNQLKEHSTKCGRDDNNEDSMTESTVGKSRKRGTENDFSSNNENSRFPPVKRTNVMEEQDVSIIGEETYEETSLEMQIKSEIRDSYETEPSSFIPNTIVPETFRVKQEPVDIIPFPSTPMFNTPRAPQHRTQTVISRVPSLSPSILSDTTSISQNQFNNSPSLNTSFSSNYIEKQALPLSAAIFTRSIQFPKELMVVWSNSLEEDLLAAVSMNSNNSILCVKELETMKIAKPQRDLLAKSQMVTFNMLDSNDTFTLWTVISFEQKNSQNGLKKKLFRNFVDVEKVLSEEAETKGMTINNIMRYSEDGIFPTLSTSFSKKTMAFNYVE